ncbi:MAG: hypothetical protein A2Y12_20325 [Planctomycetes bacterium GWF2_42_9]|nr:MAG: hypothetical protein A2Y12_20325 [Planctomycetes bacterium GWF2_42_9]HAL44781.1 hypothetical protein [Phycisphaerales bacterium]
MKKYYILTLLFLANLCLGGVYAWSIFVPELVKNYGYNTAQTQLVFGSTICCVTLVMLFTGKLENKLGPRIMLMISSVIMFSSYFTGSFSGTNFIILLIGCGILSGVAIGFGYLSVLAVSMRWFEDRKGFACGMVVAGYGLGAVLLSFIAQILLNRGWDVMRIFRFVGFVFGVVIFICAMIITNPANTHKEKIAATLKYSEIFRKKRFFILAGATGLGTFSGLMFLGNLKPIAIFLGYDSFVALMAIWIISMSNALGRMVGGVAYDRFKTMSIKTILIAITIISLLLLAGDIDKIMFLLMVITVGLSYGWLISNIPAQVSEEYGHQNFGMIFPMVFIGHGMTALFAAPLAGFIYDRYHTYRPAMILAAGIAFMCFVVFSLAYPTKKCI